MTRGFACHFVRRHPSKFVIDHRKQLISGFRVAVFDGLKNAGDVTHADPGGINRYSPKPETPSTNTLTPKTRRVTSL
jgi:hypothetical protein